MVRVAGLERTARRLPMRRRREGGRLAQKIFVCTTKIIYQQNFHQKQP
jgi:hypothetical protein